MKTRGEQFTLTEPESATLLQLCESHSVRAFQIEDVNGHAMILATFSNDGWNYLYQDGDSILTKHLFFYVLAWKGNDTAEEVATDYFGGTVLSE